METSATHESRIADLVARLDETTLRLATRIERAGAKSERADSGWTAAQIASHIALVNDSFTGVIDGSLPGAAPAAADFAERGWSDIVATIPARNEAPARFMPAADVPAATALEQLRGSTARLRAALSALSAERARYCWTNRRVGTISLYQVGDFAIAHMIRHNVQAKRTLGE